VKPQLTKENYHKAKDFINQYGRDLEKRLLSYTFEKGNAENALNELSRYQNSDGGFGNCLEPDFRLKDSSPMATSVAFQVFDKLNLDKNESIVKKSIGYLLETLDRKRSFWIQVPKEVDSVPRAMWWNYKDYNEERIPIEDWGNPTIELIGWLIKYSKPSQLTEDLKKLAIKNIGLLPNKMEMHDLLCSLRFLDQLEESEGKEIKEKLVNVAGGVMALDEKSWSGYGLRPHWVIKSPKSPLYEDYEEVIHNSLAFEINNQKENGGWFPFWEWGNDYTEWETAKMEWAGVLTLNFLTTLKNFDLIEGL